MTRLDILEARLNMAYDNLFCYSCVGCVDGRSVVIPKVKHEKDYNKAMEEISIISCWIFELNNA